MAWLGEIPLDGFVDWQVNTHTPATGGEVDADAVPTYKIYEEGVDAAIKTGSLAKQDDANTVGFYTERLQIVSGDGFEVGKYYTIRTRALIATVPGIKLHTFKCVLQDVVKLDINKVGATVEFQVHGELDGQVAASPTSAAITIFAATDMTTEILDSQAMGAHSVNEFRYVWDPATAILDIEYVIEITFIHSGVTYTKRFEYNVK